jgi:hypothetical protein
MDRRRVASWAAALALGGALGSNVRAGAVNFTGNVEADMPTAGVNVGTAPGEVPNAVAQASWITQSGWVNGWTIKDMRFDYNQATDTMQVGVNFYSIAGDPSGSPTGSDPRVGSSGGYAPANLGGRDSIALEFAAPSSTDPNVAGQPVVIAGVPEYKSPAYTGLDGFTVATPGSSSSLQNNFGTQINSAMGNLAFSPSAATPDFEFTIKNWSQFSSLNKGTFFVSAYAGSPDDVVAGETTLNWSKVKLGPQQTVIPEPSTVLGWGLLTAGAGWALRRKRTATTGA